MKKIFLILTLFLTFSSVKSQEEYIDLNTGYGFEVTSTAILQSLSKKTNGDIFFDATLQRHVWWNGTSYILLGSESTVSATGLELITETSNSGWRLIGKTASNHLSIGNNAIDLTSGNTPPSSPHGASGDGAVAIGHEAIASNTWAIALGNSTASGIGSFSANNSTSSGEYSSSFGEDNTSSGENSMSWGHLNIASNIWSTVFGEQNTASGRGATSWGISNSAPSAYETSIGPYPTNYNPAQTDGLSGADRAFNVGVGFNTGDRRDGLTVMKGGEVLFPQLIPALITDPKSAITLEYFNANGGGGLANVVDDTTPELGGTLDALDNDIEKVESLTFGDPAGTKTVISNQSFNNEDFVIDPTGGSGGYLEFDRTLSQWLIAQSRILTEALIVDDDNFTTPSATTVPSTESVKAYVDASTTGGGSSDGLGKDRNVGLFTVSNSGNTAVLNNNVVSTVHIADGGITNGDIANGVIDDSKLATVPSNTIKGRIATGVGVTKNLSATEVRSLINVEDNASADQTASEVLVADTGNNYTATDVEGILAEIATNSTNGFNTTADYTVNGDWIQNGTHSVIGLATLEGGADLDNQQINNVADGTNAQDAVTKSQLDAATFSTDGTTKTTDFTLSDADIAAGILNIQTNDSIVVALGAGLTNTGFVKMIVEGTGFVAVEQGTITTLNGDYKSNSGEGETLTIRIKDANTASVLDPSRHLTYTPIATPPPSNSNIILNSAFDDATNLTLGSAWSVASGVLTFDDSSDNNPVDFATSEAIVNGNTYDLTFDLTASGGNPLFSVEVDGNVVVAQASYGVASHSVSFTYSGTNVSEITIRARNAAGATSFSLDNVELIQQ